MEFVRVGVGRTVAEFVCQAEIIIDGGIDLLQGRGWTDGKDAAPGRIREAFQCTLIPAASTVVDGIDHNVGSLGFSNRSTYFGLTPEVASIGEDHHRPSA